MARRAPHICKDREAEFCPVVTTEYILLYPFRRENSDLFKPLAKQANAGSPQDIWQSNVMLAFKSANLAISRCGLNFFPRIKKKILPPFMALKIKIPAACAKKGGCSHRIAGSSHLSYTQGFMNIEVSLPAYKRHAPNMIKRLIIACKSLSGRLQGLCLDGGWQR